MLFRKENTKEEEFCIQREIKRQRNKNNKSQNDSSKKEKEKSKRVIE